MALNKILLLLILWGLLFIPFIALAVSTKCREKAFSIVKINNYEEEKEA